MGEGFTPAEKIVARENKDKRDSGLEIAKTYRVFLGKLREKVLDIISDKIGHERFINFNESGDSSKTLKELGVNSINIDQQVINAIDETNSETGAKLSVDDIFPNGGDQIVSMTSKEFLEYINALNKDLIKE